MKIRLTIGKLMIEIESENEEVIIERETTTTADPHQTTLPLTCQWPKPDHWTNTFNKIVKTEMPFKRSNAGRPKGARDLQKREPSHCSTCGAVHRKATMRRAGADGRPHCIECDPSVLRWV